MSIVTGSGSGGEALLHLLHLLPPPPKLPHAVCRYSLIRLTIHFHDQEIIRVLYLTT